MGLDQDLDEVLAPGDPIVWRQRKEAARRLHRTASEAEKLQLERAEAEEALREAGAAVTTPLAAGVGFLAEERDVLVKEAADARQRLQGAVEIANMVKGVLVSMTTEDHPWYLPGEPDGQPGYHCPRCKALNEIELWRRGLG